MKLATLFSLVAACAVSALAQRPGELRMIPNSVAIDRVSVGADYAGREALCEQLRQMSTRSKDVPVLPENAELLCDGDGSSTFALRFQTTPASADKVICDLAAKPSSIVFYQMRPIALRSGSTVTMAQELAEKLQPSGVTTVGRLLGSFGFVNLQLRRRDAQQPLREIGLHELHLLCKS
ncbi:MAG: hypothetical protein O3A53_02260 [Acidobacteria bacterium]|nr:hypothetical protein [Acidobacteriota bacterium]